MIFIILKNISNFGSPMSIYRLGKFEIVYGLSLWSIENVILKFEIVYGLNLRTESTDWVYQLRIKMTDKT